MERLRRTLRAALPHTIPVFTGYIFLGMAFGILMSGKGFSPIWTFLLSAVTYAGSMQFAAVSLLTASAFAPVYAFLLALMVNARHIFYGLAMLEPFRTAGKAKPYLVFGLTDETFSILCSAQPPEDVNPTAFRVAVTALNQFYWVAGSMAGAWAGSLITLDTTGIDFVMTALFTVIFLDQWNSQKQHFPAIIGVGASIVCLLLFGPDSFLLPAMALILILLLLFRSRLEEKEAPTC